MELPLARVDLELTKNGAVFLPSQQDAVAAAAAACSDLLVLSHGWNNDRADAQALYDALLGSMEGLLGASRQSDVPEAVRALATRRIGVVQVFWPSKRFAEADLIPGGGAVASGPGDAEAAANDAILERRLEGLAEDATRLGDSRVPEVRRRLVDRARALVPRLESDPAARQEYVDVLRALLDPDAADPEDGTLEFFTRDAEELFDGMEQAVAAPPPVVGQGGAAAGGPVALADVVRGARAAARRLANFATYYQMKARAGVVGAAGLAPVLGAIHHSTPACRLHLAGHSFGALLVSTAARGLAGDASAASLTLLQAAFSHNAFSADYGLGRPGSCRSVIADHRVAGSIAITYTKNDRAVGIAYPLASRLAFQRAAVLGDEHDPYGGLGRNGAQHTAEADGHWTDLAEVGHEYAFDPGSVANLRGDAFITSHTDVTSPQVAYALLCNVAAGSL